MNNHAGSTLTHFTGETFSYINVLKATSGVELTREHETI